MTDGPLFVNVVRAALADADPTPDAELLRRYAGGDVAAFERLVRRHGRLVWAVCRAAVPHDRHTAEDAFQATFLILARKANSVRGHLPGWLYQVARRAALKARKASGRCTPAGGDFSPEDAVAGGAESTGPLTQAACQEVAPLLHAEIDRLRPALRDPLLLCYFEGFTHAEAAARLGWPVGTLASRLSRAKERLRDRLVRRGVTLSAAAIGAALSPPMQAIGPGLVRAAVGPASGGVLALTEGVLFTMRMAKLKLAAGLTAVGMGLAGGGALVATGQGEPRGGPPAAGAKPDPAGKPDPAWNQPGEVPTLFPDIPPDLPLPATDGMLILDTDPPAVKLRKARFNQALRLFQAYQRQAKQGQIAVTEMTAAGRALAGLTDGLPGAADWRRWQVSQAKLAEASRRKEAAFGHVAAAEVTHATTARLEAELALLAPPPAAAAAPARREPADMDAAKKRLELLREVVRLTDELIDAGRWQSSTLTSLFGMHRDWFEAAARLYGDSPELLAQAEEIERAAVKLEENLRQRYAAGNVAKQDYLLAQAHRQWIKLELAEARARLR